MMLNCYAMEEGAFALLQKALNLEPDIGAERAASILIFNLNRPEMQVQNGTARIFIHGTLENEASFFSGTSYQEIQGEIALALEDDDVKDIVLDIDSPGGAVAGFIKTAQILRDARAEKPIKAEITGAAMSAAYGIAAQANEIIAMDPTTAIGSIGVMARSFVFEDLAFARSEKAPLKARQLNEPEGQESVQSFLNDAHAQFVAEIVEGRKLAQPDITAEMVNEKFGRGGIKTARDGIAFGMVDSVDPTIGESSSIAEANNQTIKNSPSLREKKNEGIPAKPKGKVMDLNTLKAEHPDVFRAAVDIGRAEGQETGAKEERDRVTAHLEMGEASGDTTAAVEFIKGGNALMESSVQSRYMAASIKTSTRAASEEESPEALGNGNTPETNTGEASEADVKALAADIAANVNLA